MKKTLILALGIYCFPGIVSAQYSRFIVQLTDKKGTTASLGNPSGFLSAKAVDRRARQHLVLDSTDLPVSAVYLDSIQKVPNVTVYNVSKWLNQVLVKTTDPAAITKINSFPFVRKTAPIAVRLAGSSVHQKKTDDVLPVTEAMRRSLPSSKNNRVNTLNYGAMAAQITIHEGEYLHNLGFTGANMMIAVIDAGFYLYKSNPVFDSLRLQNRILGEWDFVDRDGSTNEDYIHGSLVLSTMAANKPGNMVGSAPYAKYLLLRTEDVYSEYPVEEQNWAAAAELADSAGADMISTSLGYSDFDDASFNHVYAQRNGNTSIASIAADLAAKKGMIVTVSAGNSGNLTNDYKYVSCPGDADSVLTVGAVDYTGTIASFSSWGPNGAGKTKPNIVSVGAGTICALPDGSPAPEFGTSVSNPNVAGLIACLWQAFPEFGNMEIIDVVQKSSDKYNTPDGRYGYGLPNFHKAYDMLKSEQVRRGYAAILGNGTLKVFPTPFTDHLNVILKPTRTGNGFVELLDAAGRLVERQSFAMVTDQYQVITLKSAGAVARGLYVVRFNDGVTRQSVRVVK